MRRVFLAEVPLAQVVQPDPLQYPARELDPKSGLFVLADAAKQIRSLRRWLELVRGQGFGSTP